MPTLSDRAMSLQESAIRKLDITMMAQEGVTFTRLNIGQPDVATPQPMLDAIHHWDRKVVAYGPASGLPALRKAAADYHARWSPGLGPEHCVVTTGGSEGLLFAMVALCNQGDEIIVPEPYYTNYNGFATVAGVKIKPFRTTLSNGFQLPSNEELDAACSDRTRAVMFSNPGNPTGAVYPRSEIERLLRWAVERDIFVIADEVYRRIWFDEPPTSALEFDWAANHVICIDSMSKTFSACGLRIGFLISRNPELMEKIERLGQARLGAQPLGQDAALAALALPEAYYDEIRETYARRVQTLYDAVAAIEGVQVHKPEGAFYLMAELPIDDSESFARFLVTDFRHDGKSLVVAPAGGFYAHPEDGKRQIRLAAVVDEEKLAEAAKMLELAIEAYQNR